ncbi:hypothetical protein [Roseivirga seohaensis]|uniref:hypothetical protein n=1 Tax=Roseivirga seohaensis TaxID=1914963 RepID=UPI003BABFCA6
MSDKDNLENNRADFLAAASRSTIGLVPLAGPLLTELISGIIPNQRMDRLTKYIQELEKRITDVESDIFNRYKNNEDFVDLTEEGFIQAARAITDVRREYIASVIVNGISNTSLNIADSKMLLKILQELSDIEIIWLRSYLDTSMGGDREFREKHKNILTTPQIINVVDKEVIQKYVIQQSYKGHLERLGLVKSKISIDKATGQPQFDRVTGIARTTHTKITTLGKMLLEQIDLIE